MTAALGRIEQIPHQWEASPHTRIAHELSALGQFEDALAHYRRALAVLRHETMTGGSAPALQQAMTDVYQAHMAIGGTLAMLARYDEASRAFGRALSIRHGDALARFNRGLTLLMQGQFRAGLEDYESRLQLFTSPAVAGGGAPPGDRRCSRW